MRRIFLLCATLIFSCSANNNSDCLDQLRNDYPEYEFFVVIPKSLCKTCGSTYSEDLKDAYKSGKIGLVFNCEKKDTIAINYYLKGMDTRHLIIDTLSRYAICDSLSESIYPAVAYVTKNMIAVEYYNKNNTNAYKKLKKKVWD